MSMPTSFTPLSSTPIPEFPTSKSARSSTYTCPPMHARALRHTRVHIRIAALLLAGLLTAAACGGDDDASRTPTADVGSGSGSSPLGTVLVEAGEAVQIRSLNAITGDTAYLGLPNQYGVQLAVRDYGPVHGFEVDLGAGRDESCSSEGGQAAGQLIAAETDVIGVIGTTCSVAATAAAPLITGAGLVMIAPSNTSPLLTSDLKGNPSQDYNVGYYRTSHNGLYVGEAMALFVHEKLNLSSVAAIHDGDPYSQSIAQAFADNFSQLGGTVTTVTAVNKEDTDMVPVLTEIASGSPDALFFPIFQPAGDFLADQVRLIPGFEDVVLLSDAALLTDSYMSLPQSEGIYFSGPDLRFGGSVNQSTGQSASSVLADYTNIYGEPPSAPYWAHAYDATTLLLKAIEDASTVVEGELRIDRQGVRDQLNNVRNFSGLTGTLNCDEFGDCGAQKITVIHHLDATDIKASRARVVYEYAPAL